MGLDIFLGTSLLTRYNREQIERDRNILSNIHMILRETEIEK